MSFTSLGGEDPLMTSLIGSVRGRTVRPPLATQTTPVSFNFASEDDTRSQTSYAKKGAVAQTVPPVMEIITPEERKQRIFDWEQIYYNGVPIKDVKEDIEAQNAVILGDHDKHMVNLEFSKNLVSVKEGYYIPYHAWNVHISHLYGETLLSKSEESVYYKTDHPKLAFGSTSDYAQGAALPVSDTKEGKLENVYLIQALLYNVRSTAPFALGVLLGELDGPNNFTPFSNRRFYANPEYNRRAVNEFHHVLPPFYSSEKELGCYNSSYNVNSPYGYEFTYLTQKYEDITKGYEPGGGDFCFIPYRSPILKWAFTEADLSRDELPMQDQNKNRERFYRCRNSVFHMGVEAVRRKVCAHLPVVDMNKFAIQFVPLQSGHASKETMSREVFERENTYTVGRDYKRADHGLLKDNFSVSFSMKTILMYRDIAESNIATEDNTEIVIPY